MFGFFKKKQEPIIELTIQNLTVGATLEYDMRTWVVYEVYNYLWENNCKSKEYKISDGSSTLFLEVGNEENITITKPSAIEKIAPNFKQEVLETASVPESLIYNSEIYKLAEESFGNYQKERDEGWSELTAWMFWNDKDEFICIERWSKFEFEAHLGKKINPFSLDNLLPGK
jgi:hypothetical protein